MYPAYEDGRFLRYISNAEIADFLDSGVPQGSAADVSSNAAIDIRQGPSPPSVGFHGNFHMGQELKHHDNELIHLG